MEDQTKMTRSILKQQDTEKRGRRLSFARGLLGSPTKPADLPERPEDVRPRLSEYSETAGEGDITEVTRMVVNPFHKRLEVTPVGLCYVPPVRVPKAYKDSLPIIPMKDNSRNVFVTALKSKKSAKVLIIGQDCEGEVIKEQLLLVQKTAKDKRSMKWEQKLEIVVKGTPTPDDISDADYFIFLVHLYHMDSIKILRETLSLIESHAMPSIKGTVLYQTQPAGVVRNVISYDSVNELMDAHQLYHIQWTKPSYEQYLTLLTNIHESTGYYSGLSLLSKSVLKWNDKYEEE